MRVITRLPFKRFPMTDITSHEEFDTWAETYDESVSVDQFPFHGYREVLTSTFALAEATPGMSVLDLGTGTGNLAVRFAKHGCELWCTDFSAPMLAEARYKTPSMPISACMTCTMIFRSNWTVLSTGSSRRTSFIISNWMRKSASFPSYCLILPPAGAWSSAILPSLTGLRWRRSRLWQEMNGRTSSTGW